MPDKVSTAPPVAVARLATELNVDASAIGSYGVYSLFSYGAKLQT
ncbi:hypothetical protein [Nocardia sp. NPDC047038]